MLRGVIFLPAVLLFTQAVCKSDSNEDLSKIIDQIFGSGPSKPHDIEYPTIYTTTEAPQIITIPDQTCTTLLNGPGVCMDHNSCLYLLLGNNNTRSIDKKERDDPCIGIMNICCPNGSIPSDKKYLVNSTSPDCGKINPIIDSTSQQNPYNTSAFAEFPWMVAVLRSLPPASDPKNSIVTRIYKCGGSLIHPRVVMTGARCAMTLTCDTLVRVGEWDTQSSTERLPHQDMAVVKIIMHEEFNKSNLNFNIALLILETEVQIAENVGVVCLPPREKKIPQNPCIMSGWGKDTFDRDGRYQTTLKKLELPLVNNADCNDALKRTRLGQNFKLHSSFICAGGKDVDACVGDGGSPLVCKLPDNEHRYFQYGIVSWGIGCRQSGVPGVYTDVASIRQWIDQKLIDNHINMDDYRV